MAGLLTSARVVLDQQLQIAAAEARRVGGRYLQLDARRDPDVAAHINRTRLAGTRRHDGRFARKYLANPLQGNASFGELLDSKQAIEVLARVASPACFPDWALEQANLDVVADGALRHRCKRAEVVEGEGCSSHNSNVTLQLSKTSVLKEFGPNPDRFARNLHTYGMRPVTEAPV